MSDKFKWKPHPIICEKCMKEVTLTIEVTIGRELRTESQGCDCHDSGCSGDYHEFQVSRATRENWCMNCTMKEFK